MEILLKSPWLYILLFFLLLICYKIIRKNLFFNHRLAAHFGKHFYNYYHSVKKVRHLRVSNYGYAPLDEEIFQLDPNHQHGLQLYKELVKNQKGFLIPEKSSVVEVGCGKGGGAEYLINRFNPVKYTGIDYSEKAIDFCNEQYTHIKNANFICADAHQLPLAENSVEVVINVESSHIYKNIDRFLLEIHRILKPGGKFLLTDYRIVKNYPIEMLENKITSIGFKIAEKRIITPQVLEACMQDSERRKQIIDQHCPWYLKKYLRHFAILKGTKKSVMLANGEIIYFIYHLEK